MKHQKRLIKLENKLQSTENMLNEITEILKDKNLPLKQFKKLFKTKNALTKRLAFLQQQKEVTLKVAHFDNLIAQKKAQLKNNGISEKEKVILQKEIEALENEKFEYLYPALGFVFDFNKWFPSSQDESAAQNMDEEKHLNNEKK